MEQNLGGLPSQSAKGIPNRSWQTNDNQLGDPRNQEHKRSGELCCFTFCGWIKDGLRTRAWPLELDVIILTLLHVILQYVWIRFSFIDLQYRLFIDTYIYIRIIYREVSGVLCRFDSISSLHVANVLTLDTFPCWTMPWSIRRTTGSSLASRKSHVFVCVEGGDCARVFRGRKLMLLMAGPTCPPLNKAWYSYWWGGG